LLEEKNEREQERYEGALGEVSGGQDQQLAAMQGLAQNQLDNLNQRFDQQVGDLRQNLTNRGLTASSAYPNMIGNLSAQQGLMAGNAMAPLANAMLSAYGNAASQRAQLMANRRESFSLPGMPSPWELAAAAGAGLGSRAGYGRPIGPVQQQYMSPQNALGIQVPFAAQNPMMAQAMMARQPYRFRRSPMSILTQMERRYAEEADRPIRRERIARRQRDRMKRNIARGQAFHTAIPEFNPDSRLDQNVMERTLRRNFPQWDELSEEAKAIGRADYQGAMAQLRDTYGNQGYWNQGMAPTAYDARYGAPTDPISTPPSQWSGGYPGLHVGGLPSQDPRMPSGLLPEQDPWGLGGVMTGKFNPPPAWMEAQWAQEEARRQANPQYEYRPPAFRTNPPLDMSPAEAAARSGYLGATAATSIPGQAKRDLSNLPLPGIVAGMPLWFMRRRRKSRRRR
jgi:hypothetical protein